MAALFCHGTLMEALRDGANAAYNNAAAAVGNATEAVKDSMNQFSSSSEVEGSSEFLQSNSILAKFAFLILALIVFFMLVNLGIMVMGYFIKPPSSPYLVSGTANANSGTRIAQDPKDQNAVTLQRSNNQKTGIEFTYSIWLYINDVDPAQAKQYQNIFNKGNATYDASGIATVGNGPGLYLDNVGQELTVVMNTVSNTNPSQRVNVPNIPLRKWFHVAIRLENKYMDVYINGTVTTRMVLQDVPKQNYLDVQVCQNGGFNGSYADLRYFDHALTVFEINNIVVWGRNTSTATGGSNSDATGFPYYLSNLWYSANY
jgi:hypothetical protein